MGKFFIQPKGELDIFFELNATTDISISHASRVTSYPVESGANASDNVVIEPVKIELSGVLTDVKQAGFVGLTRSSQDYKKHPEEYIKNLEDRVNNKELFTLYATDSLRPIDNVVVTSFKVRKDNKLGGNSWSVSLSLQQVRKASRAQVDVVVDDEFSNLLAGKTTSGANSSDLDGKQQEKTFVNYSTFRDDAAVQKIQERGWGDIE